MKNRRKIPDKFFPFFWYFMKKYKFNFFLLVIAIIVLSDIAYFFIFPYLLKNIVDGVSSKTLGLKTGIIFMIGFGFCDWYFIFEAIKKHFTFLSISKAIEDMRINLFSNSLKQSTNFFQKNFSGELNSKINCILDNLEASLITFLGVARNFFLMLMVTVVFLKLNVIVGLIVLVWFIAFTFIVYFNTKRNAIKSNERADIENKISGIITDDFVNISNIKIFAREKIEKEILKSKTDESLEKEKEIKKIQMMSGFLNFVFVFFIVAFIAIFSGKLYLDKAITFGTFFFMLELSKRIANYTQYFGWELNEAIQNLSTIKNGLSLVTHTIEIENKENAKALNDIEGKIVFKHINFNYSE